MRLDQIAAQTWNQERSIEQTSAVIHDGAKSNDELASRAKWYVEDLIFGSFPQALPAGGAAILEIGSGHGWIMEALNNHLSGLHQRPTSIVGLDIAPNMVAQAKERLGTQAPFDFLTYDGITVPLPDSSLDFIYSVASLQHVPKPYVFNLFFEITRLLKPDGFAVLHFLSTQHLIKQENHHTWRLEIQNQINGSVAHWHHFYTRDELIDILSITGFQSVAVKEDPVLSLVACVSKRPHRLPRESNLLRHVKAILRILWHRIRR